MGEFVKRNRDFLVLAIYLVFLVAIFAEYRRQASITDRKWDHLRSAIYVDAMQEVHNHKGESS